MSNAPGLGFHRGPHPNMLQMSEEDLQRGAIELAEVHGWHVAHFRPAKTERGWRTAVQGNGGKGFLDMIALRHPRLLVIEFKSAAGRISDDQHVWLQKWGAFAEAIAEMIPAAPGIPRPAEVTVGIWTPADWIDRTIHKELERR